MKVAIKNFEGIYSIDINGTVFNELKGTIKKPTQLKIGYLMVDLYKNNKATKCYIHRLLAEHFIPNSEPDSKKQVNHIDGNKLNNSITNLEWVTHQDNLKHARDTGLKTYTNRLTEREFLSLLGQVLAGKSYAELSTTVDYKVPFLSTKLRAIAKKYGKELELNNALELQRATRTIRNLKQYSGK